MVDPYADVLPYAICVVAGSSVVQLMTALLWLMALVVTELICGARVSDGGGGLSALVVGGGRGGRWRRGGAWRPSA